MDQLNSALTLTTAELHKPGQLLKPWQPGQVLQARVLDASTQGRLLLGIGGREITALTQTMVPKGASLRLEVVSLYPVPSLQIIPAPLMGPMRRDPLENQLQVLLPQQGSVTGAIAAVLDPAQRVNILSLLGLKNDVLERLEKSLNSFELLADIKLLRKALRESGIFFESELLRLANTGGAVPQGDLKALLLRLLQKIKQAARRQPATGGADAAQRMLLQLQSGVEGALATITLNQLAGARAQDPQGYLWVFDMPFRIRNSLRNLSISVEGGSSGLHEGSEQREWKVFISLSLPRLGPLEAELLIRGTRVSLVIYAQHEKTHRLLAGGLGHLRAEMEKHGLKISVLRCQLGRREEGGYSTPWRQCVDVQA